MNLAVDNQPSARRTPSPTPAPFQAAAPAPSLSGPLTPHQRLQAFAYTPPSQHAAQAIEYGPSARASGLRKSSAASGKGAER